MTAKVSEVRVNDGFVKVSSGGLDIIINERNGFFNVTQLCRSRGEKKLSSYNNSKVKKNLKIVLTCYYGELSHKVNPNNIYPCVAGTYFHPALFLDLASWLSPESYVHSAIVINDFFGHSNQQTWQLSMLFACEEIPTIEYVSDPPIWRIRYDSLEMVVNERGWFKASDFCAANYTKLSQFEASKSPDIVCLLQYFRSRNLLCGVYYHPLLFLRLAAWMTADFYVKCARVVFCCGDGRLKSLFRKEIIAAGSAAPSDLGSVVTFNRSSTEREGLPVELSQPSTSSGRSAVPRPDFANVIWNVEGDDSNDSDSTVHMTDEVGNSLTRKELEVEVARVRRELRLEVERERAEKDAALARVQEKEAVLQRVQEEKRKKDEELELLQRKFEDLQISEERSRMTLRKRSSAEARTTAAANVLKDVGVAKLECLVLFVSEKNAVYAYRRQFQNIIPTIHKQLNKVVMFVGWFVTNNAVLDFNRCKGLVREKATKCGHNVRVGQNQMELDDEEGDQFNLPDAIRTTLRMDLEVIEADVRILGRLFNKPIYGDSKVAAADSSRSASTSTFLTHVHKWFEDEHACYMRLMERRRQRPRPSVLG